MDTGVERKFNAVLAARWSEYRAERYLQSLGSSLPTKTPPSDARVNTPIQLFLAHNRITRARLEIQLYTELLKDARPALLEGKCYLLSSFPSPNVLLEFDEIVKESMNKADGLRMLASETPIPA